MIFFDTNVFVYAAGADALGERCRRLLMRVAGGEVDGATSVAVLEELWHLELSGRAPNLEGQTADTLVLMAPLLSVDEAVVRRALAIEVTGPGAMDRVHAATCLENGIEAVVSADRGFDRFDGLRRIDPSD